MTRLSDHVQVISAPQASCRWMLDTFRDHIVGLDGLTETQAREQQAALGRILHVQAGRAVVAVPTGYADDFLGWAVELDGSILFAYVREAFRRGGIAAKMVAALTDARPVGVAYWTEDADHASRRGYPVAYSIYGYRALLRFVRRPTTRPAARAA